MLTFKSKLHYFTSHTILKHTLRSNYFIIVRYLTSTL